MDEQALGQVFEGVQPAVPVMSRERFAELSGVAPGVVEGWSDRRQLPTVVIGKHRLVNLVLLYKQCLEVETYK